MGAVNPSDPVNISPHLAPFLVNNNPVPDEGQLRARRDADLAGIQNAMSRLMGEYHAVASAYATVLSPIRRVPPEIWTEVFKYCTKWPACLEIHHISIFPPWIYARVCASWRAIVFSMPKLWDDDIRIQAPDCMALKDPAAILRTVFSLCSPTDGFNFRFFGYLFEFGRKVPNAPAPGLPLLELLVQESPRWRSASLHLAGQEQVDAVKAVRGRLPLLSHLDISCRYHSDDARSWSLESLEGFEDAPALTRLHIDGPNWKFEELSRFPWSQLSSFYDERTCVEDEIVNSTYYTDILSQSTGLESLKITAAHERNVVSPRVVHTGIKSLEFYDSSILSNFSCPNVTRITRSNDLFSGAEDTPDVCDDLREFISASCGGPSQSLTYLDIVNVIPNQDFLSMLGFMPALTDLTVDFSNWPDDIALVRYENMLVRLSRCIMENPRTITPELIPRLEALQIAIYDYKDGPEVVTFLDDPLAGFLRSRVGLTPLKSVQVGVYAKQVIVSAQNRAFYKGLSERDMCHLRVYSYYNVGDGPGLSTAHVDYTSLETECN